MREEPSEVARMLSRFLAVAVIAGLLALGVLAGSVVLGIAARIFLSLAGVE